MRRSRSRKGSQAINFDGRAPSEPEFSEEEVQDELDALSDRLANLQREMQRILDKRRLLIVKPPSLDPRRLEGGNE